MLNARQYIDEVKLRLSRHNVTLELDDPTICTFVNRARREVQYSTLGLLPECYGKIVQLSALVQDSSLSQTNTTHNRPTTVYRVSLPLDFIEPTVVMLRYTLTGVIASLGRTFNGETYDYEARRVDKRELFGVQMQSWNQPSIIAPVYVVEKKLVDLAAGALANPILYLGGLDIDNATTLVDVADRVVVEVWYTAALPDLELVPSLAPGAPPDQELALPMEFEELVVYNAMIDCLQKIGAQSAIPSVKAELELLQSLVEDTYSTVKLQAGPLLPSKEAIQ